MNHSLSHAWLAKGSQILAKLVNGDHCIDLEINFKVNHSNKSKHYQFYKTIKMSFLVPLDKIRKKMNAITREITRCPIHYPERKKVSDRGINKTQHTKT